MLLLLLGFLGFLGFLKYFGGVRCMWLCVRAFCEFFIGVLHTHARRTHARTHNIIHTYTKLSATQIIYE